MPIGAPGWPELAFCTASIAKARIAPVVSLNFGGLTLRVAAIFHYLLIHPRGIWVVVEYTPVDFTPMKQRGKTALGVS
jgi:hypothetical protein